MRQYQLACAKYFELTHNVPLVAGFNHPNQYFEESQKILSGGKANNSNYVSPAPQKGPVSNNCKNSSVINYFTIVTSDVFIYYTYFLAQKSRTMEEELMDDSGFEGINFDVIDNV